MELMKEFRFEASHRLPMHPGKCSRLHGHSWVLRVYVKGTVDPETGFVMDYADLKKMVDPLIAALDHRHLGTWGHILTDVNQLESETMHLDWFVPELSASFYPSSENLIKWIGSKIDDYTGHKFWSRLELDETCTSSCILTREDYEGIDAGR